MILTQINKNEVLRYLGKKESIAVTDDIAALLDECEQLVLTNAKPKYIYKEIALPYQPLMQGNSIKKHLESCQGIILLAATLGDGIDRLIRINSISSMDKAIVIDALASAAIEQVCNKADEEIAKKYPEKFFTYRFSPGYGDYPIELQNQFVMLTDSPRKIGLTLNAGGMLTPTKSVTAVIGVSDKPLEKRRSGCAVCKMRNTCKFRKEGLRCEF